MFSFSFSDEENKLILGSYNMNYAEYGTKLNWHKVVDTTYWTLSLKSVNLGDFNFQMNSDKAIIDSGSSYIHVPYLDFQGFSDHISNGRECWHDKSANLYVCKCWTEVASDFPNLEFLIDNNSYVISSKSYM